MNQIVYCETMRDFINSCLVSKDIGQKVKQSMYNAGYSHVMDNWVRLGDKNENKNNSKEFDKCEVKQLIGTAVYCFLK